VPLTASGYAIDAGDWLADAHAALGDAMLAIVLAHLALIVGLSVLHRRNHALPMLTGRVDGAGPDLVRANRTWLAALLLAGVLAFVAWQWHRSPHGLLPPGAQAGTLARDADD